MSTLGVTAAKNLMAANQANPSGYWESARLSQASDELLATAGSSWHDWLPLDADWMASAAAHGHHHRIKAILENEFAGEPLFFIKDPRICRFVPLISSILAEMKVDAVSLLPIRNPLEVAHSLKRREGFPLAKSLMIWLSHVLEAERNSRSMPRHFLHYEDFVTDWRRHLAGAADGIGLIWPAWSDRAIAAMDSFLSTDLRHERFSIGDLRSHGDVSPMVLETYETLSAMAAEGDRAELRDRLDEIRAEFDAGRALLGRAIAAEQHAASRTIDDLRVQIGELKRERRNAAQDRRWLTGPLRWFAGRK